MVWEVSHNAAEDAVVQILAVESRERPSVPFLRENFPQEHYPVPSSQQLSFNTVDECLCTAVNFQNVGAAIRFCFGLVGFCFFMTWLNKE